MKLFTDSILGKGDIQVQREGVEDVHVQGDSFPHSFIDI